MAGSNQDIIRQLKAALTLMGHSCGATVAVLVANGPLDSCHLEASLGDGIECLKCEGPANVDTSTLRSAARRSTSGSATAPVFRSLASFEACSKSWTSSCSHCAGHGQARCCSAHFRCLALVQQAADSSRRERGSTALSEAAWPRQPAHRGARPGAMCQGNGQSRQRTLQTNVLLGARGSGCTCKQSPNKATSMQTCCLVGTPGTQRLSIMFGLPHDARAQ